MGFGYFILIKGGLWFVCVPFFLTPDFHGAKSLSTAFLGRGCVTAPCPQIVSDRSINSKST